MLKKLAAIGLGAAIVFSPMAALAQTDQPAAPAAGAEAAKPMAAPTGSHRSHHRRTRSRAHQRARAGAAAAQNPAAPKQ